MIVLGVDPGGRDTGLAVVDTSAGGTSTPPLLASATVHRLDRGPLEQPGRAYLTDVLAASLDLVRRFEVKLIAVEAVRKPKGHAAGRKGHLIDPAGLMGTAVVFGAVFGRSWTVPVIAIQPGGNGTYLPLGRYPAPIGTTGKGNDKRRHERSAYDVAVAAPQAQRWDTGGGYGP